MRKVLVALPDETIALLDKALVGKLGEGHSDTLRTIILNWLTEQGYMSKDGKAKKSKAVTRDLAEEIDLHDTMITSLVELLEQRNIVTQQEWAKRIKERVKIE